MLKHIRYYLGVLILFGTSLLLQSCPGSKNDELYLLPGFTKGRWQWVQTITPTRTITPQSAGFNRQMALSSDNTSAYVAFYRNDTLQLRYNEISNDTMHTFVDQTRQTVLIQYGKAGYLKYTITSTNDNSMLTVSDFLPNSSALDSVKNIYRRENLTLYPY